jgi:hypothetical protein
MLLWRPRPERTASPETWETLRRVLAERGVFVLSG